MYNPTKYKLDISNNKIIPTYILWYLSSYTLYLKLRIVTLPLMGRPFLRTGSQGIVRGGGGPPRTTATSSFRSLLRKSKTPRKECLSLKKKVTYTKSTIWRFLLFPRLWMTRRWNPAVGQIPETHRVGGSSGYDMYYSGKTSTLLVPDRSSSLNEF